jgi:uncharacterized protein (TIGR00725 family)
MIRQSDEWSNRPAYVAVIGPGDPSPGKPNDIVHGDLDVAQEVGRLLAANGAVLICGGLGGVMRAACKAARDHEPAGITVGFLPGDKHDKGNEHLSIEIPTGLGELRNGLVVGAAEAVIVVGGSWGTMNEISLAMKQGKPVVQIGGWTVTPTSATPAPHQVADASEAVQAALSAIQKLRNVHESLGAYASTPNHGKAKIFSCRRQGVEHHDTAREFITPT